MYLNLAKHCKWDHTKQSELDVIPPEADRSVNASDEHVELKERLQLKLR